MQYILNNNSYSPSVIESVGNLPCTSCFSKYPSLFNSILGNNYLLNWLTNIQGKARRTNKTKKKQNPSFHGAQTPMTTAGNPVSCFVRFTAWNQGRLTSISYTNWYLKWQKIDKIRFTLSPIMATKGSSFIITSHKQPEDKTRSIPVNGVTWKNLRL